MPLNVLIYIINYAITNIANILLKLIGKNLIVLVKDDDEYVEDVVCKEADVKENEMKVYDLKDAGKVLLIKQNGKISALGTKCTHYGAPLDKSALADGRIRCQWHGACFNIATGDIEDFPGLDSLPCYKVTIVDENVKVKALKKELETNKRVKHMVRQNECDEESFVVVGGGPAGATCVETLRQEGFAGKITLVCKENALPYDRIKVSKALDVTIDKLQLRDEEFYLNNGINVLKNTAAISIDTNNNEVALSNGTKLHFDKLFVATGSKALKAKVPGADLNNVLVLRNYNDAEYLLTQLDNTKQVVVLGSSFIALETAASCVSKVNKLTLIARGDSLLEASFGSRIGNAIKTLFEEKGINFVMQSGIKRCVDGGNGSIGSVELIDGTILQADVCVMGVGSGLNTEFLKGSNIEVEGNGTIEVDDYLRTNNCHIFAGGDIAKAPVWSHDNMKTAIGHYPLAHMHGRIAALNMMDKKVPLKTVPFFWTMLFGKGYRYAGHGRYDDIIYNGNVEEHKFVAYYLKDDKVIAISSCGLDPIVSQFAELLHQGKSLYRKDIENNSTEWINQIH